MPGIRGLLAELPPPVFFWREPEAKLKSDCLRDMLKATGPVFMIWAGFWADSVLVVDPTNSEVLRVCLSGTRFPADMTPMECCCC